MPLFSNTEVGFTKLLAMSIKPMVFLSSEYIVRRRDHGSEVRVMVTVRVRVMVTVRVMVRVRVRVRVMVAHHTTPTTCLCYW